MAGESQAAPLQVYIDLTAARADSEASLAGMSATSEGDAAVFLEGEPTADASWSAPFHEATEGEASRCSPDHAPMTTMDSTPGTQPPAPLCVDLTTASQTETEDIVDERTSGETPTSGRPQVLP